MNLKLVETTIKIKTNIALDNVTIEIPDDGITGIFGDYGSGKSTVLSIFAGYRKPDSGMLFLDRKEVQFTSVRDAIKYKIGSIDPNLNSYDKFTIRQNLILDPNFKTKNLPEIEAKFREICHQLDIKFDFNDLFGKYSNGQKLIFEIVRHYLFGIQVILIDEPFRYFEKNERTLLIELFKLLKSQQVQFIFSTKDIDDVYQVCDYCVFLEKGRVIGQGIKPFANLEEKVPHLQMKEKFNLNQFTNQVLLQIKNIQVFSEQEYINYNLHSGEIVGLVSEDIKAAENLLYCCAGLQKPYSGEFILNGFDLLGKPLHDFINDGIALIPENRLSMGLIPEMTIYEHFGLFGDRSSPIYHPGNTRKNVLNVLHEYGIKTSLDELVKDLSNIDQMKLLFAILPRRLSLLVCFYPLKGLDVETKYWVWNQIRRRALSGIGIIVLNSQSSEYQSHVHTIWQYKEKNWEPPVSELAFFKSVDYLSKDKKKEGEDEFS